MCAQCAAVPAHKAHLHQPPNPLSLLQSLSEELILGGEFAMWGDMWTVNRQCWDEPNWKWLPRAPVAHWMHDQEHDKVFMDSMAGLVSFPVCKKCVR